MKKRLLMGMILILAAFLLVACGGNGDADTAVASTGDAKNGEAMYNQVCIACHGPEGSGVENLGKPFNSSMFVFEQSDDELLAFVKIGRPISDPENTTGVDMPPKGGNPALTDEEILDIIAYIRTLQQ